MTQTISYTENVEKITIAYTENGEDFTIKINEQARGPAGADGTIGVGVPAGGSAGQALSKIDATDYNTQWSDVQLAGGPLLVAVKNDGTATLTKGQVVYFTGANGENILIGKAQASTEPLSSKTIGFTYDAFTINGQGYVITEGFLTGLTIPHQGCAVGDPIWLSPTTAGGVIFGLTNKPSSPNHLVYLGVVKKISGANVTEIYVKVQNGFELQELHNVTVAASGNALEVGDILACYNNTSNHGYWKNEHTSSTGTAGSVVRYTSTDGLFANEIIVDQIISKNDAQSSTSGTITIGDYTSLSHLWWSIDETGQAGFVKVSTDDIYSGLIETSTLSADVGVTTNILTVGGAATFNAGISISNGTESNPPRITSGVGAGIYGGNAILTGNSGYIVTTNSNTGIADAVTGSATALTSFGIRSTAVSSPKDLRFANTDVTTTDKTLTWVVGNSNRTITLSGNPTLGDWFDQSVKVAASPTFANGTFTGNLSSTGYVSPSYVRLIGVSGSNEARIYRTANGVIAFYDAAETSFGRIQLGGTSSAFPSIKRNGTAINIRLADDSADAPLTASNITASGTLATGSTGTTASLDLQIGAANYGWYYNAGQIGLVKNGVLICYADNSSRFAIGVSGGLTVTSVTESTTTATGAIVTAGGVGIAKNLNVGGNITGAGVISTGGMTLGAGSSVLFTGRSRIKSTADGEISIRNNADTSYANITVGTVTQFPAATVTPTVNGQLVFEATSNTSLTVKLKGTDGVVRSAVITLA